MPRFRLRFVARPDVVPTPTRPLHLSRRALVLGAAGAAGASALGHSSARATAGRAAATGDGHAETTVFTAGDDGLAVFHVFGLTRTPRGTVLAFAEGRIAPGDADPHHLVLRRSVDEGHSWQPMSYVQRSDGTRSLINPTPVVDHATGRVLLFFAECARNPDNDGGSPDTSRVHVTHSDDDGLTWSTPTELTPLFAENPHGWTMHAPGPGHGVQLADGRLLVQLWHRRASTLPVAERRYGASVVYSDDGGASWQAGGTVPVDDAYPVNESRLVERPDGAVSLWGRYASSGTHPRIAAHSADRGASWSAPVLDAAARPVNAVDTGFARLTGDPGSAEPSRVVFSRPDSADRENLTVSVSYDEGMTWPYSRVLTEGPASYSDAVALADGRVGVLYGRDHAEGITENFSGRVVFAALDLEWLTAGADTGAAAPEHLGLEVEALELSTDADAEVAVVEDPAASGGRRAELAGADVGSYLEAEFAVERAGAYDVYARLRHLPEGGTAAVSLDGAAVGAELDTSGGDVRTFRTELLGRVELAAGAHAARFTLVEAPAEGGLRLSPDLLSLVPR